MVRRTLHALLCLLTALELCGGHLGVAQMVAWARMVGDYSAEKGIVQGLKETFDGEHPCARCCKIAEEKRREEKKTPLPPEKLEPLSKWLTCLAGTGVPELGWMHREPAARPVESVPDALSRRARPPVPPPRALA